MKIFLFIGESLGWQELIMIGVVALIVLGPRKLPQLAKTLGKTMADFRKMTNDFKETWEKEASIDEDVKSFKSIFTEPDKVVEEHKILPPKPAEVIATPQIKELSSAEIADIFKDKQIKALNNTNDSGANEVETKEPEIILSKKDWL